MAQRKLHAGVGGTGGKVDVQLRSRDRELHGVCSWCYVVFHVGAGWTCPKWMGCRLQIHQRFLEYCSDASEDASEVESSHGKHGSDQSLSYFIPWNSMFHWVILSPPTVPQPILSFEAATWTAEVVRRME